MRGARVLVLAFAAITLCPAFAQDAATAFAGVEAWKAAVRAGDAETLRQMYAGDPPVRVYANGVKGGADSDINFWLALKPKTLELTLIRDEVSRTGQKHHSLTRVEATDHEGKRVTVIEDQYWVQQGEGWRLFTVMRTDNPKLSLPANMNTDLYPASADARADLATAEKRASEEHKRVLLVFGANWCFDCHVLDLAFRRTDFEAVLGPNYEIVHVDLGPDEHKNADLVAQYEIPLNKGVPALAVAESDGKLVVSQKNGEFENARGMTADALLEFLNHWKPQRQ